MQRELEVMNLLTRTVVDKESHTKNGDTRRSNAEEEDGRGQGKSHQDGNTRRSNAREDISYAKAHLVLFERLLDRVRRSRVGVFVLQVLHLTDT